MTTASSSPYPDPGEALAAVRHELERLIERRLYRPLNDDELRQWDHLTRLEDELLAIIHRRDS
ncbi:MAG: hypothetical protein KGQ66_00545 [Acidobacteriota bacterium]|nr:hypothetical protein [Acidobacteriota bacterium]